MKKNNNIKFYTLINNTIFKFSSIINFLNISYILAIFIFILSFSIIYNEGIIYFIKFVCRIVYIFSTYNYYYILYIFNKLYDLITLINILRDIKLI